MSLINGCIWVVEQKKYGNWIPTINVAETRSECRTKTKELNKRYYGGIVPFRTQKYERKIQSILNEQPIGRGNV